MTRLRVLLVDDQPLILLGLERMLRRMRNVWEVLAAGSGAKAQEMMEGELFDALVTDLNMPGYGGVELLEWTRVHHPATARVVLSGHQDKRMIQGATRLAHRFLTKPCVPEQLVEAILQTSELLTLAPGVLRGAVGGMGQLPGSPVTAHKIKAYLQDPDADLQALFEVVTQDPGLAAKALHLVNAAFFGVPRPLVDPWEAFQLLDREKQASLVAEPVSAPLEALLKPIREEGHLLARRARAIALAEGAPPPTQNLVFTGGLLTAAGPMLLALASPEAQGGPGEAGVGPASTELAWHYLNLLGLPRNLLDLVRHHPQPALGPEGRNLALAALHVASGRLDEAYLSRTGFLDRISSWRQAMHSIEG